MAVILVAHLLSGIETGPTAPSEPMRTSKPDIASETAADRAAFALLTPVMLLWYAWCRLRGRIESRAGLIHAVLCALRGPTSGSLGTMHHEEGYCFRADLPGALMDDARGRSAVELLENGRVIGPPHASHDEVRELGGGRFNHWDGYLWFSSSDNTDPRTNGRNYTFRETWR